MKDKDFETRFPWTLLFITCSISYFGFIRLMRLLNVILPPMFLWIGIVSLLLGCFSAIFSLLENKKIIHGSIKIMNTNVLEDPPDESHTKGDQ
ncbi:MAG: hypothetical protein ACHQF0_11240 [Chitinophagales bacterium]